MGAEDITWQRSTSHLLCGYTVKPKKVMQFITGVMNSAFLESLSASSVLGPSVQAHLSQK